MTTVTSDRLLASSALWNLLGQALPLVAGVLAIPALVNGLGVEGFGILSLLWLIIGYFGLLDLGLGRALTKLVAEKLGTSHEDQIPSLVWTAIGLMLLLGTIGTAVTVAAAPWLVSILLNLSSEAHVETERAFVILAASIPLVTLSAALRGFLEANQRFDYVNFGRVTLGLLTYLFPLLVLPFSRSLIIVAAALLVSRIIVLILYAALTVRTLPSIIHCTLKVELISPLVRFGGWITVSSVVGPAMVYLDRLLIGAVSTPEAVAYYAAPYEIATRLLMIPTALVGVLFPALARAYAIDKSHSEELFIRGAKYTFVALIPAAAILSVLAHELLALWLSVKFADESAHVLRILTVGVAMNGFALLPLSLLHAAGRPDVTAKLHLLELPPYLVFLWWGVAELGIAGAAIVWTARATCDAVALFILCSRIVGMNRRSITSAAAIVATTFGCLAAGFAMTSLSTRIVYICLILAGLTSLTALWVARPQRIASFSKQWIRLGAV